LDAVERRGLTEALSFFANDRAKRGQTDLSVRLTHIARYTFENLA
jgi:hypothetical protein